jgi:hypothetical protein
MRQQYGTQVDSFLNKNPTLDIMALGQSNLVPIWMNQS